MPSASRTHYVQEACKPQVYLYSYTFEVQELRSHHDLNVVFSLVSLSAKLNLRRLVLLGQSCESAVCE